MIFYSFPLVSSSNQESVSCHLYGISGILSFSVFKSKRECGCTQKDMSNEISVEQALYGAILSPGALLRDYLSFFPLYVCAVFNGFRSLPAHAMFFLCCRETSFHAFKLFSIMNKFSTFYYKKKKKKVSECCHIKLT